MSHGGFFLELCWLPFGKGLGITKTMQKWSWAALTLHLSHKVKADLGKGLGLLGKAGTAELFMYLLLLSCLRLKIIFTSKRRIFGWHVPLPFNIISKNHVAMKFAGLHSWWWPLLEMTMLFVLWGFRAVLLHLRAALTCVFVFLINWLFMRTWTSS